MFKRILFLVVTLLIVNNFYAQENKHKPTVFGDFKGYFDTDVTYHAESFSINAARQIGRASCRERV